MNQHSRDRRKIDPGRGATPGDGTANDGDRVEIGPTALARVERPAAGLREPGLAVIRARRHARPAAPIAARESDAPIVFDRLDIR